MICKKICCINAGTLEKYLPGHTYSNSKPLEMVTGFGKLRPDCILDRLAGSGGIPVMGAWLYPT
jgi:hypothetical protein